MLPKVDAVCWDLETLRGVEENRSKRIPGIEYVNAPPGVNPWDCKDQMGISVLTAFDCLRQRTLIYFAEDIPEFLELLAKRALSVMFNGVNFDAEVLRACGHIVPDVKQYDILLEAWDSNGRRERGFRLQDFLMANFGYGKTLDGALAPVLWQQGKRGQVATYCADDSSGTAELLYKILEDGRLQHPSGDGRVLRMRKPFATVTASSAPKTFGDSAVSFGRVGKVIGLVPEIQPGLLPDIPDKVVGYHKEVKPEGAPKSSSDAPGEVKKDS